MDTPDASNLPNDPHDAAAYWFAREHGGLMTAAERQEFEAWRRADAAHERAYQEMMAVWGVAKAVPDHKLRPIVSPGRRAADVVSPRRRQLVWGLGLACSAAVVAGVVGPQWWTAEPSFSARYATNRGERRRVTLPDDSVLDLNTATVAMVRFYDSERVVQLQAGEIMFTVASNKSRPFIVDADLARVRVTGTRFDVRRDAERLAVAVESGSVEVSTGSWWRQRTETLTAGLGVNVASNAPDLKVESVNVAALTAWRQGKAVFDGTPLAQVVEEMNRYRSHPIHVQAGSLRQLRIAGVFNVDDTDSFLDMLPTLAPVVVLHRPNGDSLIVAR